MKARKKQALSSTHKTPALFLLLVIKPNTHYVSAHEKLTSKQTNSSGRLLNAAVKCMCFIWQKWIREPTRRANGGCTDLIGWPGRRSTVAYYALPVGDVKRARLKSLATCNRTITASGAYMQNNSLTVKKIKINNSKNAG